MEYCAQDIEHIPGQPDDEEAKGEPIGGLAPEVLDDLRGEDDDPAGDRY